MCLRLGLAIYFGISSFAAFGNSFHAVCENKGFITHGEKTLFDGRTGRFETYFSDIGRSGNERALLDLFSIPASELLKHEYFKIVLEFDRESCWDPDSPYAFDNAGCSNLRSLTLLASNDPYYRPRWTNEYEGSFESGSIGTLVSSRRFRRVDFKSVDFVLTINGKEYTPSYGNVCESSCTRNDLVHFPALDPRPSFCEPGGGI
jgi:hypothetical protein